MGRGLARWGGGAWGRVDKATFKKGYRERLERLVRAQLGGRAPEKVLSFNELKKAHAAAPDDPDVAARLAERYLGIGDADEAKRLAAAARAARKNHARAAYVLARVELTTNE